MNDDGYLLYCAYRPGDPLDLPDGVEEIAVGELAVAARHVSRVQSLSEPDRDELIEFQQTVSSIFADRTVVPFRWGSIARTRGDLEEMLTTDGALWRDQLARLDDLVEMGIRRWLPTPEKRETPPSARGAKSGGDYLRRRKAAYDAEAPYDDRHPAIKEIIDAVLGHFSSYELSFSRQSAELFGGDTVSIAFLVPRDRVEEFERAFAAAEPFEHASRTELTGPWPPYSFV